MDGQKKTEAKWGLPPAASAKLALGNYRIVAVLESTGKDPGTWKGRVESEPVILTIRARSESLQGLGAVESDLDLARYWSEAGDWGKSLVAARKAAEDDPNSIESYTLIGDALSDGHDPIGALSAYGTALSLYNQQYKGKGGDPDYLLVRMSRIMDENPPKDLAPFTRKVPMPTYRH